MNEVGEGYVSEDDLEPGGVVDVLEVGIYELQSLSRVGPTC